MNGTLPSPGIRAQHWNLFQLLTWGRHMFLLLLAPEPWGFLWLEMFLNVAGHNPRGEEEMGQGRRHHPLSSWECALCPFC